MDIVSISVAEYDDKFVSATLFTNLPDPTYPSLDLLLQITLPKNTAAVYLRDNFPDVEVEYLVDLPNMGLED
jgi:hypothetical protein